GGGDFLGVRPCLPDQMLSVCSLKLVGADLALADRLAGGGLLLQLRRRVVERGEGREDPGNLVPTLGLGDGAGGRVPSTGGCPTKGGAAVAGGALKRGSGYRHSPCRSAADGSRGASEVALSRVSMPNWSPWAASMACFGSWPTTLSRASTS